MKFLLSKKKTIIIILEFKMKVAKISMQSELNFGTKSSIKISKAPTPTVTPKTTTNIT